MEKLPPGGKVSGGVTGNESEGRGGRNGKDMEREEGRGKGRGGGTFQQIKIYDYTDWVFSKVSVVVRYVAWPDWFGDGETGYKLASV